MNTDIAELIDRGRSIEGGLTYVPSPHNVMRMFDVYKPSDVDEYYRWKEHSIRFLQLYYPTDIERFVKYSEEFEKHHYIPRFISNMVGVLEACEALPSEKIEQRNEIQAREKEIEKVEELEKKYQNLITENSKHLSSDAFHVWHAACVLFDKWFYPTDDDWVKFQNIDGSGNGYVLNHYFDMIYSP